MYVLYSQRNSSTKFKYQWPYIWYTSQSTGQGNSNVQMVSISYLACCAWTEKWSTNQNQLVSIPEVKPSYLLCWSADVTARFPHTWCKQDERHNSKYTGPSSSPLPPWSVSIASFMPALSGWMGTCVVNAVHIYKSESGCSKTVSTVSYHAH